MMWESSVYSENTRSGETERYKYFHMKRGLKIFQVWVSERLVVLLANIGSMGKGPGLGEMTKSLVLLINACFLMCILAISKWDVTSLATMIKHFYFVFLIVYFGVDSGYLILYLLLIVPCWPWEKERTLGGDGSQFPTVFGILVNSKLCCTMMKPDCFRVSMASPPLTGY